MKVENRVKGSYRNIIKCFQEASPIALREGASWYKDANLLADVIGKLAGYKHPKSVIVGAGILAALSPQVEWGDNVSWAIQLVTTGAKKTTKANYDKAIRIKNGESPMDVLGGMKVRAFYKAIVAPTGKGEPVIDRHALAVYLGRQVTEKDLYQLQNPKVVNRIQWAYRKASRDLDIHHHKVQAVTWNWWRIQKGIVPERDW